MEKGTFKLSFKPINVAKAIHILSQDLNNDQMSDEIIQEIGEVFMKHMFYKIYEGNENLINNSLPNEFNELDINEKKDIEENKMETEENINVNNSLLEQEERPLNNFNEREEKKKLMKYLTLGWYIYNYLI